MLFDTIAMTLSAFDDNSMTEFVEFDKMCSRMWIMLKKNQRPCEENKSYRSIKYDIKKDV